MSDLGNPYVPEGWVLMAQAEVTPVMTAWAVAILRSPAACPMFSQILDVNTNVLACVEWHPPDANNESVHRGVTLYVRAT